MLSFLICTLWILSLALHLRNIEQVRREITPISVLWKVKSHSVNPYVLILGHLWEVQVQGDLAGEVQPHMVSSLNSPCFIAAALTTCFFPKYLGLILTSRHLAPDPFRNFLALLACPDKPYTSASPVTSIPKAGKGLSRALGQFKTVMSWRCSNGESMPCSLYNLRYQGWQGLITFDFQSPWRF